MVFAPAGCFFEDDAKTVNLDDDIYINPAVPPGVALTAIVPQVLNAPSLTNPYITISFNMPVDPSTINYTTSIIVESPIGTPITDYNGTEQSSYQEIKSQPTKFLAGDLANLGIQTYALDVQVDGTNYPITFNTANTDTWADIAQKIENSLTAATPGTETCEIINGRIRIISGSTGANPTIEISAGTAPAAGGDFLAAVDILPGYTTEIANLVNGYVSNIHLTLDVGALGLTGGETIRIVLTDALKAEADPLITLYNPVVTIDVVVQN